MLENLNELEKIGLAFISGLAAGYLLEIANQEVEKEEKTKVTIEKIEDEKAEKLRKIMKELVGE